jgi:hypothetical protein
VECATDDEIERALQELTLDFGVVTRTAISRPLQLKPLGSWRLNLWVPRAQFPRSSRGRRRPGLGRGSAASFACHSLRQSPLQAGLSSFLTRL